MNNTINLGDFVLITCHEENNYLKIGEVIDIEFYENNDIKGYTVRFEHSIGIDYYGIRLQNISKVIKIQ